ncbi:MAG: tetratricopeptide repeat protein [Pseudonocardiaceae bacterium]
MQRPAGWAALTVLFLALASFVFVFRAQQTVGTSVPMTGFGPVLEFLVGQSSLLLVFAVLLMILALWAFRRFRFAQLARKPGPVEILPFVKEQATEAPVENIVAHFRKSLRDVSLSPPMSMPGDPVSQDFLHVLRTATSQATGTIGAVVGMLSALQVNSAYRVSGVLAQRANSPCCGLTVHIATLPRNIGAVQTFWADDWFEVAEFGAYFAGSYILPRSSICARPPWTAWHRLPIPHKLFHRYQVAQAMLRKERYEEALDALFSALHEDPQNPYIRIQVAQLREQLGQHLDAVGDYIDIIEIQAWRDRRLWKKLRRTLSQPESAGRPDASGESRASPRWRDEESGQPLVHLGSHRNGPEALLVARYRLVSALAHGSHLARQWYETDLSENPRRREERGLLRDRMLAWLVPRYAEFRRVCVGEAVAGGVPDDLREFLDTRPDLLPLLFQFIALRETLDLIKDYSWTRGRRRPNMSVPQSALRILAVWTALHLMLAELTVSKDPTVTALRCEDADAMPIRDKLAPGAECVTWPPEPEVVELLIKQALRWKPRSLRGWQEHYNSASAFAVMLLHEGIGAEKSERIAIKAVRCLERAVLTTGSGISSQYSKWLAFGDQDLNGLRRTDSFAHFNDRYFPRSDPRKAVRSLEMLEWVLMAHIAGLVRQYVVLRADFWESRVQYVTEELVAEEAAQEEDAALMVADYIQDHWSWQVRLQLIREGQHFTARTGCATPFDSRFPSVDTILGMPVEGVVRSGHESPPALTADSRRLSLRRPGSFSAEHMQMVENGTPSRPAGQNGRPADKEQKRLGELWRTIDTVVDAALRGDESALRELETTLRRVVSTANRVARPGGEQAEPAPAAAADSAQS